MAMIRIAPESSYGVMISVLLENVVKFMRTMRAANSMDEVDTSQFIYGGSDKVLLETKKAIDLLCEVHKNPEEGLTYEKHKELSEAMLRLTATAFSITMEMSLMMDLVQTYDASVDGGNLKESYAKVFKPDLSFAIEGHQLHALMTMLNAASTKMHHENINQMKEAVAATLRMFKMGSDTVN